MLDISITIGNSIQIYKNNKKDSPKAVFFHHIFIVFFIIPCLCRQIVRLRRLLLFRGIFQ